MQKNSKKCRKIALWVAAAFMVILFAGCGFIGSEGVDEELIPKEYLVRTNSAFYTTTQIPFTGDPATDFGGGRLFASDPAGDMIVSPGFGGTPTDSYTNIADMKNIYVAYSARGLYIGVKMDCDPASYSTYKMALYLFIDNNVTSGPGSIGLTAFDAGTVALAGLSGQFGFDDPGARIQGAGGKISFYLKHWREAGGAQWKPFYFWNGTGSIVNTVPFGYGFQGELLFYPPNGVSANVTEVYIPWKFIFGDALGASFTALPSSTIKLWLGTDPTLNLDGYSDCYPDNVGPDNEWNVLTTAGEWGTLTVTD